VTGGDRTAVLVIRAWFESGPGDDALRARITRTADVAAEAGVESAAATEDEILAAVRDWLDAFTAAED
jgi:hypothetical protein